jgi:hypothetical protein
LSDVVGESEAVLGAFAEVEAFGAELVDVESAAEFDVGANVVVFEEQPVTMNTGKI